MADVQIVAVEPKVFLLNAYDDFLEAIWTGFKSCYSGEAPVDILPDSEQEMVEYIKRRLETCLLYTSPSPRDRTRSRMPSSA